MIINLYNKRIRKLINKIGLEINRYTEFPADFNNDDKTINNKVQKYHMTSPERIKAVIDAVKYINLNKIKGDFVECGVWKGGSIMAMALTLNKLNDNSKKIYLYDTYSGMTEPTKFDVSITGKNAEKIFNETKNSKDSSDWCLASIEDVKNNVFRTNYDNDKFVFVKGKVENTIPKTIPKSISLLRLDTDWYESTKHELTHLFPLVSKNGVIILDDYSHWNGVKKAVDEYFDQNNISILLNRIDHSGRIGIKVY